MIYIIIASLFLFRIMVYPSLVRYIMIRQFEKQAKVINDLFEKIEKEIEKNEKSS